jgi:hypothetical protein
METMNLKGSNQIETAINRACQWWLIRSINDLSESQNILAAVINDEKLIVSTVMTMKKMHQTNKKFVQACIDNWESSSLENPEEGDANVTMHTCTVLKDNKITSIAKKNLKKGTTIFNY